MMCFCSSQSIQKPTVLPVKNNKALKSESFKSEVLSVMIKRGNLNAYVPLKVTSHIQCHLRADHASHCSFNNYPYKLYIF